MAATLERSRAASGSGPGPAGLRVAGRKRRRPAWVALGVMVVAGSGLAFATYASSLSDRVSVLAAARDIPAGDRIELGDLRVVDVAADSELATVDAARRNEIAGEVAVLPIPRGALMQRSQFEGGTAIPPGGSVVGVALKPGALPVEDVRVGDRVSVVRVTPEEAEELGEAVVWAVSVDPSTATGSVVSLLVADGRASAVAHAAGLDQVRLILVEQARGAA